jgi:hypothetical protein
VLGARRGSIRSARRLYRQKSHTTSLTPWASGLSLPSKSMAPSKGGKFPPGGRGFKPTKAWSRGAYSEFTHEVIELLRSSRLKSLTIRLGEEQIAEARLEAEQTGVPYQTILRQWVAFGAANAQRSRKRKRGSASPRKPRK